MDMELLKLYIKQVLQEADNLLGEPDTTTEKHRDEPQPQYEEEEEQDKAEDADEASVVAGIAGHIGPVGATGNGPGNKPYGDDDERN